ncbi:hypothetical protein D3C81_1138370 [compost metagenome]
MAGVAQEHAEQLELAVGQRGFAAVAVDQAAAVDVQQPVGEALVVGAYGRTGGGRAARMAHAAHQVLRPRHQFARVDRLAHVVVGAAFEADDAVDVVVAPGDEDDADLRAHAQLAGQGQAVLAGQADVEHHQVDWLLAALGLGQAGFGLLGGVGAEHVVAFLGEVGL